MSSQPDRSINVLAYFPSDLPNLGGCEIYRVTQPLFRLGQTKGFQAMWMPMGPDSLQYAKQADIIVLPRTSTTEEGVARFKETESFRLLIEAGMIDRNTETPLIDMFHLMKKKVVFEVDDDFTNKYRQVHLGGKNMMTNMAACDAVTVSTPHLQKFMEKETGLPVFLCRNYVNIPAWRHGEVERRVDGLTIGLTGSTTHVDDWRVLDGVLDRILEKYPETKLIIGGFHPSYLPPVSDRVQYIGYVPYQIYTATMRSMDVVLCPVDPHDQFNLSKSPIKAMEGNAAYRQFDGQSAGAAVIATNNPVYSSWIRHGYNGLLVDHTPESWFDAIEKVITNQALRKQLSIQGYRYVQKNGSMDTGWTDWAKAYRTIVRGD